MTIKIGNRYLILEAVKRVLTRRARKIRDRQFAEQARKA